MQLDLHKHNEYTPSTQQLHSLAYSIDSINQKIKRIYAKQQKVIFN